MSSVLKPQDERGSLVKQLLAVCDNRLVQIKALEEEKRRLEKELAFLKNRKKMRSRSGRGETELT